MSTTQEIDLDIEGMTCAACAQRIERKLNKLEGVTASVNYATERAHVTYPATVAPHTLQEVVAAAGYAATPLAEGVDDEAKSARALAALRLRVWVSGLLSVPIVAVAMVPPLQFAGWQWFSLVLATPLVTWAAWPFHRAAALNLRHGAATMDTLVSLGVLAAYLWSVVALFFGTAGHTGMQHTFEWQLRPGDGLGNVYFEAAAGVTTFLLAGRYFEKRSKVLATAALRALAEQGVSEVRVRREGALITVSLREVRVGDEFVVGPGETIATDGEVVEGSAAVDVSLVTGESVPLAVTVGDQVVGATVNTDGELVVRASRVGKDTVLGQMTRLVEEAQTGKAQVQRLADRISGIFVPVVLLASLATLVIWWSLGATPAFAIGSAVAVLIVACPCALGLATPTALMVGTGRGAQLGVLLSGPEALEATDRIDRVVIDKTGTLTSGQMTLTQVVAVGATDEEVRRRAAAAEAPSLHPVARALARAWEAPPQATEFRSHVGEGVSADVEGERVIVGTAELLARHDQVVAQELLEARDAAQRDGATAVLVAWGGQARGMLAVSDQPRPEAAVAIADFARLGIPAILATGDNFGAAQRVAEFVGITEVRAGLSPADKVAVIRELQDQGLKVAMIGDGINDGAALAQADLGIAMGAGSDVAKAASDITLMGEDLGRAVVAVRLARRTLGTIKGNLFWAFAYNVAAIPAAALGLLHPMLAGGAMALSSVFVVSNSLRLRAFR